MVPVYHWWSIGGCRRRKSQAMVSCWFWFSNFELTLTFVLNFYKGLNPLAAR